MSTPVGKPALRPDTSETPPSIVTAIVCIWVYSAKNLHTPCRKAYITNVISNPAWLLSGLEVRLRIKATTKSECRTHVR